MYHFMAYVFKKEIAIYLNSRDKIFVSHLSFGKPFQLIFEDLKVPLI